jgi:hypothetical protein
MVASQDGFVIDALAVVLTVALALAALYVAVGVVLLPLWAIGAAFRVGALRRVGGGWWLLPWLTFEAGGEFIERFTAERDGSRWKRPEPKSATRNPEQPVDWARGLGTFALWALAIVGGLVLLAEGHDSIIEPLSGGPAAVWFAVAIVLVTVAAAGVAWVLSRRFRSDRRPPAFRLTLTIAIVGGVLSWMVISDISSANQLAEDYCSYGAVTERQLATCQTHVSANHIRSIDTPASRFAQGDSTAECGAGSGPFCERVLNDRYLQEQEPPPGQ